MKTIATLALFLLAAAQLHASGGVTLDGRGTLLLEGGTVQSTFMVSRFGGTVYVGANFEGNHVQYQFAAADVQRVSYVAGDASFNFVWVNYVVPFSADPNPGDFILGP